MSYEAKRKAFEAACPGSTHGVLFNAEHGYYYPADRKQPQWQRERADLLNAKFHGWCIGAAGLAADDEIEVFLAEVRAELIRARSKFPGDRIMTIALAEGFGELCKAVLDESAANVRKEAVQTAVMAARVALDGDGSVRDWRRERGLDALAACGGAGDE